MQKGSLIRSSLVKDPMFGSTERATLGAEKYGDHNWDKGGEDFSTDTKNHLIYHLWCFLNGKLDDEKELIDHLKGVHWNGGTLLALEQRKLDQT